MINIICLNENGMDENVTEGKESMGGVRIVLVTGLGDGDCCDEGNERAMEVWFGLEDVVLSNTYV